MEFDINRLLSCLQGVKQVTSNHWMACCPCHDDHNPSLSVTSKDGKLLVKCFAGCDQRTLWNRLLELAGVEKRYEVYRNGKNGQQTKRPRKTNAGNRVEAPNHNDKDAADGDLSETPTPTNTDPTPAETQETTQGCSLQQIAEAKGLPAEFLKELGVSQWYDTERTPRLRIPYYDQEGNEIGCRLRMNLDGKERFKWRKGSKTALYGLWKLQEARDAGYVLLVEGESDCWTLWYCGLPAVGMPGKDTWREELAHYLQGLRVYIWQEPDAPELPLKVGLDIPDARVIHAQQYKDPSEAFVALGRERFVQWMQEQMQQAEPVSDILQRAADAELQQLYEACKEVREHPDPWALIKQEIARLYAGDPLPAYAAYLAATTRLLPAGDGNMPAHLLLVGSPSCGKSHALKVVQRLLPESAYVKFDATSQRALIYATESFQHRVLFVSEADSLPTSDRGEENPAASAVRTLLQDGAVVYAVVVQRPSDTPTVRLVRKDGPTTLVSTSTRPFGEQLGSRLFTFPMRDDTEQLRAVVQTICDLQNEKPQQPSPALVAYQEYLQRKAPIDVKVPFASALGRCIARNITGPRILRDLQRLFALIKAVAILRGRTEATLDDYAEAASVVEAMYEATSIGVTERMRSVVHAVYQLRYEHGDDATVNLNAIAEHAGLHPQQVKRAVNQALAKGWLVNRSRDRNYDLIPGEPLPDEVTLPTVTEVQREWLGDPDGTDNDPIPGHDGSQDDAEPSGVEIDSRGFTPFHTFSHGFHAVSRISRAPEVSIPPSPLSREVDASGGGGRGESISAQGVKRVKWRETGVKQRDDDVTSLPNVDTPWYGGACMELLPLHRWLLKEFAGQSPTWSELQRRTLEYWRDDDSDDGWGVLFTRDDLVEAMRELLDAGLVQRVVVDGVGMYRFPPVVWR